MEEGKWEMYGEIEEGKWGEVGRNKNVDGEKPQKTLFILYYFRKDIKKTVTPMTVFFISYRY